MARDSLFGERIVWSGRPKVVAVPAGYRLGALAMATMAAVATSFAVLVGVSLHGPVGGLLAFAAWCATLAVALRFGPAIWRAEAEYLVTEEKVIYKRGRLRRTIDRKAVSYARIHWYPGQPGVGDLELVRAVPTGALRRRLSLTLPGLAAPDRVWAIVRGVAVVGAGDGHLPIAQRLEDGERVLWSARPAGKLRDYVPAGSREVLTAIVAALVAGALVREISVAVPVARRVLAAGMAARSLAFASLVAGITLTALLLAAVAAGLGYFSLIRPARLWRSTRYVITEKRVLIQRGSEELSLDRSRIAFVIDAPTASGVHDLFLVLDGPRARALATSGAFGEAERQDSLLPVLHAVADHESVSRILRIRPTDVPPIGDAA